MQNTISKGKTNWIIGMHAVQIPTTMVPLEREKFIAFKNELFEKYKCYLVLAGEDVNHGPYYVTSNVVWHNERGFEIGYRKPDQIRDLRDIQRERLEKFCDDHGFTHESINKIICSEYYTIFQEDLDMEKVVDLNSNPFEDLM